jgi:4-alpha-glucanotransferase
VAYTGTHDNDTTQGWWNDGQARWSARRRGLRGAGVDGRPVWPLIRAAEASVAEMAVVPAQDLLELGSEARMNTPPCRRQLELARAGGIAGRPNWPRAWPRWPKVTDRDNDPLGEGLVGIGQHDVRMRAAVHDHAAHADDVGGRGGILDEHVLRRHVAVRDL